jgi:hypothetical protein
MADAIAREDRYAIAALAGMGGGALRHALRGDPEAGLVELEDALAPWPKEPWSGIHMGAMIVKRQLLASMRDGTRYARYMDDVAGVVGRAFIMRSPVARVNWLLFVAQSRLHSITHPRGPETARLLEQASVPLRTLARQKGPTTRLGLSWSEGGVLLIRGDRTRALEATTYAMEETRDHLGGENFVLPSLHYLHGALVGGASGRAECAQVKAQLETEGWSDWRNGLNMRMPIRLELLDQLADVRSSEL